MPELHGSELREWHHRYASGFEPVLGARDLAADSRTMDSLADALLELADALLESDRHGRLGGRDWLRARPSRWRLLDQRTCRGQDGQNEADRDRPQHRDIVASACK